MSNEVRISSSTLRLEKVDITDYEVDSIVYYAQHDLKLGSGFGNAIMMRGGPGIQEDLDKLTGILTTEVVTTAAGDLKANYIIHAVGPRFQEKDLENKLKTTIRNSLKEADARGIKSIAFPPMGTGFYGVPLPVSARITLGTVAEYLQNGTNIENVVICLNDSREFQPFSDELSNLTQAQEEKK